MIDWAEAGRVAGIGFGMVFAILALLMLAIEITGLVLKRTEVDKVRDKGPGTGAKPR